MTLEEQKQLHKEFMVAALSGLSGLVRKEGTALEALEIADAALLEYQKRWEGEKGI